MMCDHYSHFMAEETEHGEAKYFASDYTARKWLGQDSNPGSLHSLLITYKQYLVRIRMKKCLILIFSEVMNTEQGPSDELNCVSPTRYIAVLILRISECHPIWRFLHRAK